MKVLALNGSPRKEGNTFQILKTMGDEILNNGIEFELIEIGSQNVKGCTGCAACRKREDKLCVIGGDSANETIIKMRSADGIIIGSPTYYGSIAGVMKCFLDRAFYSSSRFFKHKVAAAVTAVRRDGGVGVIHQLNNYFNLAEMIIAPSQYWQAVYCSYKNDYQADEEGFQTVRKNARAMAWLLKVLEAGKPAVPAPAEEERAMTNFVR